MEKRAREFALFNLGIHSKLRGCDLAALKVRYICHVSWQGGMFGRNSADLPSH
jgi:hypothetical protein